MWIKIGAVFLAVNIAMLFFGAAFQDSNWVLNSQTGYFSALFVMVASFWGYQRKIKSAQSDDTPVEVHEDRDAFDEIGDKYGVFDEYETVDTDSEEEIESEKPKKSRKERFGIFMSKLSLGSKLFFSVYRLFAYALLILGVLYLVRHDIWNVFAYIIGTTLTMVSVMISGFLVRSEWLNE